MPDMHFMSGFALALGGSYLVHEKDWFMFGLCLVASFSLYLGA